MPLMTNADFSRMRVTRDEIIADNSVEVTIRRGTSELAAQTVRIARIKNAGGARSGPQTEESRGRVIVVGDLTFDVAVNDRLNDGQGNLYRVALVRPTRTMGVVAEAEVIE